MSETIEILGKYREWEPFKKVEYQLRQTHTARVYFFATSCGQKYRALTKRKVRAVCAEKVKVPYKIIGWKKDPVNQDFMLAVRVDIASALDLVLLWELLNSCKLPCGDSPFLGDGQDYDIQVVPPNYICGIEEM